MTDWGSIRAIPVGGLVAVGFVGEDRVIVGSHSGLGVFHAATGVVLGRVADPRGDYDWFRESPPTAVYADDDGQHSVPICGLWGGTLPAATGDGWICRSQDTGAALVGPSGRLVIVEDDQEPRACGFSPQGRIFAFATSSTLHIAVRAQG